MSTTAPTTQLAKFCRGAESPRSDDETNSPRTPKEKRGGGSLRNSARMTLANIRAMISPRPSPIASPIASPITSPRPVVTPRARSCTIDILPHNGGRGGVDGLSWATVDPKVKSSRWTHKTKPAVFVSTTESSQKVDDDQESNDSSSFESCSDTRSSSTPAETLSELATAEGGDSLDSSDRRDSGSLNLSVDSVMELSKETKTKRSSITLFRRSSKNERLRAEIDEMQSKLPIGHLGRSHSVTRVSELREAEEAAVAAGVWSPRSAQKRAAHLQMCYTLVSYSHDCMALKTTFHRYLVPNTQISAEMAIALKRAHKSNLLDPYRQNSCNCRAEEDEKICECVSPDKRAKFNACMMFEDRLLLATRETKLLFEEYTAAIRTAETGQWLKFQVKDTVTEWHSFVLSDYVHASKSPLSPALLDVVPTRMDVTISASYEFCKFW